MRKLKLDVDALRVESFEAAASADEPGTVMAMSPTGGSRCTQNAACATLDCDTPRCITFDPVECA